MKKPAGARLKTAMRKKAQRRRPHGASKTAPKKKATSNVSRKRKRTSEAPFDVQKLATAIVKAQAVVEQTNKKAKKGRVEDDDVESDEDSDATITSGEFLDLVDNFKAINKILSPQNLPVFIEGTISNHGTFDDILFNFEKADVPTSSRLRLFGKFAIGKSKVST